MCFPLFQEELLQFLEKEHKGKEIAGYLVIIATLECLTKNLIN
jgi:hypothetical protein